MANQNITVHQIKRSNKSVEKFKQQEWAIADKEHFGLNVDLSRRDFQFYAKNTDGDILGVIEMNIQGDLANITTLLVSSTKRRKGIGRALIERAEKLAIQEKCKKIWLETNENWDAEHFYIKVGYKIEAKLKKHIFNQTALILVKFLAHQDSQQ